MVSYNLYTVVCFFFHLFIFLFQLTIDLYSSDFVIRQQPAKNDISAVVYTETRAPVMIRPCATHGCLISKYFLHLSLWQRRKQRFNSQPRFSSSSNAVPLGRGGGRNYPAGSFQWQQHSLFSYPVQLTRCELRISMDLDKEKSTVRSYNNEKKTNWVPIMSSKSKLFI